MGGVALREGSPQTCGIHCTKALPAVGGARRYRCDNGELWRLPSTQQWPRGLTARQLAEQLLGWAHSGWFGFVDGGHDDEGAWLVRRLPPRNLSSWLKSRAGGWPWREAATIALQLANALAVAEESALFMGALTPSRIWLDITEQHPPQSWLRGERLLLALVGAHATQDAAGRASGTRAEDVLWAPPELAEDERWGHAHNRYALGAVLYRLLAGTHPFAGAGLRHAMQEAANAEPAPFSKEVRRRLPAGLQSLCLRLIARKPAQRPAAASIIGHKLAALIAASAATPIGPTISPIGAGDGGDDGDLRGDRNRQNSDGDRSRQDDHHHDHADAPARAPSPRAPVYLRRYAPLLLGGTALAAALLWWQHSDAPAATPGAAVTVAAAQPLDTLHTTARDCASCHPQHSAQWSQSVMGHAVKSPLFNALEALIEEQVGRDFSCPNGAGILRRAEANSACRARVSGVSITGSGGEHWCINCHSPGDNLNSSMPAWQGLAGGDPRSRLPLRDLLSPLAMEGISCAFCHQVRGPVGPRNSGGYEGNPSWISIETGRLFEARPEDRRGVFGISNSGYRLDPAQLLLTGGARPPARTVRLDGDKMAVHARPSAAARRYLQSSQFCGSCHDVRLFGTDVLGGRKGEHFKRLRNAYSEWDRWARGERAAGRQAASCQDCHMSSYPGICVTGDKREGQLDDEACPAGMRFEAHQPGRKTAGHSAISAASLSAVTPHYFTAIDLPLTRQIDDAALSLAGVDHGGVPLSAKQRRNLLLRRSMRLTLGAATRQGNALQLPVIIENVGAGHRAPAGFSQEREVWLHLRVTDGAGRLVYEVGRVERNDEDLHDKIFLRVNTDPNRLDGAGRPVGLFGADVADGPDVPRWSPPPELGGDNFRGRGLINFQNGFLRCVRCVGSIGPDGRCQPNIGERHRAERFADGDYDIDSGRCGSNLSGRAALFETYFPVGGLDAERGIVRGPDAIVATRSLAPKRPVRYVYELSTTGFRGPFRVEARLLFRSFPPFLIRAFASYEQHQVAAGKRPSGPLVTLAMLQRLDRITVAQQTLIVP